MKFIKILSFLLVFVIGLELSAFSMPKKFRKFRLDSNVGCTAALGCPSTMSEDDDENDGEDDWDSILSLSSSSGGGVSNCAGTVLSSDDETGYVTPEVVSGRVSVHGACGIVHVYPYLQLMDFRHGDLVYGTQDVRRYVMDELRGYESRSGNCLGAITADEFNKAILFNHDPTQPLGEEILRLISKSTLSPIDVDRFVDFSRRLLIKMELADPVKFKGFQDSVIHVGEGGSASSAEAKASPLVVFDPEKLFYMTACEEAILFNHEHHRTVHFILDGIIQKSVYDPSHPFYRSYTSNELRSVFRLWKREVDRTTSISDPANAPGAAVSSSSALYSGTGVSGFEGRSILETVRFYYGGARVQAPWLDSKGSPIDVWMSID